MESMMNYDIAMFNYMYFFKIVFNTLFFPYLFHFILVLPPTFLSTLSLSPLQAYFSLLAY